MYESDHRSQTYKLFGQENILTVTHHMNCTVASMENKFMNT